jgi:hypothetical protein
MLFVNQIHNIKDCFPVDSYLAVKVVFHLIGICKIDFLAKSPYANIAILDVLFDV